MKTSIGISALLFLSGCAAHSDKNKVEAISRLYDPKKTNLEGGYNRFVERSFTPQGSEYGLIHFRDASEAKYWFISHHAGNGIGGSLFELSDGTRIYMSGWFCCEVQLPEAGFANQNELKNFIRKHDGIAP